MTKVTHQKHTHRLPNAKKSDCFGRISKQKYFNHSNVHKVSRNTAYSQKATAVNAVNEAFSKKADDVIFHLPVTKAIIAQMILGLYLICFERSFPELNVFRWVEL